LKVEAADPDLNGTAYQKFLSKNFGPLAETVAKAYPLSAFNFTPSPSYAAQSVIITDNVFKCTIYRGLLATAANGVDVWTYSFNHTSACSWNNTIPQESDILKALGPAHGAEIPFVFGNVDHLPAPNGNCTMTAGEKAISAFMEGAWTNMAASGKPSMNDADWPKWNQNASMGIVVGDTVEAAKVDYSICEFWDQINAVLFGLDANSTAAGNATTSSPTPTASSTISGAGMVFVPGNVLGMSLLALFLGIGVVLSPPLFVDHFLPEPLAISKS
jgi:carboxylesterase type B